MVVRPDSDVERALKAFGDLSLKYRSFGAIPLRLGGTSITGQSGVPSLDGIAFDTLGTDQPTTAADTFPLLGSALSEARDVHVAPRQAPPATGYGSGYPASVTWQAPPPASLTEQALGRPVVPEPAPYVPPPAAYVPEQVYAPAPSYVPAPTAYVPPTTYSYVPPSAVPAPIPPELVEPEAVAPPPEPEFAPAPVVERPAYISAPSVRPLPQPDVPMDSLPTIFSHMRAAAPEPEIWSEPEPVFVPPEPEREPVAQAPAYEPLPDAGTGIGEPLAAAPEPIEPPLPIHAILPVEPPAAVVPMRAGLARRGPPAQKQPLAGLFRSLAHPEPPPPVSEPVAPEPLAP